MTAGGRIDERVERALEPRGVTHADPEDRGDWTRILVTKDQAERALALSNERRAGGLPYIRADGGVIEFLANAGRGISADEHGPSGGGASEPTGYTLEGAKALDYVVRGFGKGTHRSLDASLDEAAAVLRSELDLKMSAAGGDAMTESWIGPGYASHDLCLRQSHAATVAESREVATRWEMEADRRAARRAPAASIGR